MIKLAPLFRAALLVLAGCLAAAPLCPAATLDFEKRTDPKPKDLCVFDNGKLKVEFAVDTFWTIGRIYWNGKIVGQDTGGTGTVVYWDGLPIGTVHRKGDAAEKLESVEVTVDGKTIPLVADGKSVADRAAKITGKAFVLVKKSRIGPFEHEARFTLSDASESIDIRHNYEAVEEITAERFSGFRYVFMHMMPIDMTEWITREPDGSNQTGSNAALDIKTPRALWTRTIRALACYSPKESVGIAYRFPENYPGQCHLALRPGKDVKFRAILFDCDHYALGEKLGWSMSILPFTAAPDAWQKEATSRL